MKPRIVRAVVLSFLVIAIASGCRFKVGETPVIEQSAYTPEEQVEAAQSLLSFVKELDAEHGDTWEQLSQNLRKSTSKLVWSATMNGLMAAFGRNIERGGASFVFTEKMPDAPPGRYFICDVASKFERGDVTERFVLVREGDQWKVAGYFRMKTIHFQSDAEKP